MPYNGFMFHYKNMNLYSIIRKISTNKNKSLQYRFLLILCFYLALTGCANNTHVRTQRILNKGDIVLSGSLVVPVTVSPKMDVDLGIGSSAARVESSLLFGMGIGELGLFTALVPFGPYEPGFFFGQELRGYVGRKFKVEIFRETANAKDIGIEKHVSMIGRITTVTDRFVNNYHGIHLIHAFSEMNRSNYLNMVSHERTMKGFGYTKGFENDHFQIQGDYSFLFSKSVTGSWDPIQIFRLSGAYKFLKPSNSSKLKEIRSSKLELGPSALSEKKNITSTSDDEEKLVEYVANESKATVPLIGNDDESTKDTMKNHRKSRDSFVLISGDRISGEIINENDHSITIISPQLGTLSISKDRIVSWPKINRMEQVSIVDSTKNYTTPEMEVVKFKSGESKDDRQLRLLVDQRMKELDDLPTHKYLMNFGLIPSCLSMLAGGALGGLSGSDDIKLPIIIGSIPISIYLTLKILSNLPNDISYPDEIRTDEEKNLYRSLLIKKIKRKYLVSSFQSIGAFVILNMYFEALN